MKHLIFAVCAVLLATTPLAAAHADPAQICLPIPDGQPPLCEPAPVIDQQTMIDFCNVNKQLCADLGDLVNAMKGGGQP
jgi:hypothetical protein